MNGFVKLRRGLAAHVRDGRMTIVEHGVYTLLLQLADYRTGRWRGSTRTLAAAAGLSQPVAFRLLSSLDRKGYLRWHRAEGFAQIVKFHVENAVDESSRDSEPNRPDSAANRLIRKSRSAGKNEKVGFSTKKITEPSSLSGGNQNQEPMRLNDSRSFSARGRANSSDQRGDAGVRSQANDLAAVPSRVFARVSKLTGERPTWEGRASDLGRAEMAQDAAAVVSAPHAGIARRSHASNAFTRLPP